MTQRLDRRGFLAATGAAAGSLAFLGPKELLAQEGSTLRFALSTYPPSFDAWASSGTAAGTIKLMMHRGLLSYGPDGAMRGELAESWEVDDEGAWVFTLREGATWHDGSPVTAEDIAWNVTEAQKPDSAAYFQGQLALITSVETPDERTVRMVTEEPLAVLPGWFAHYHMPMLKKGEPRDTTIGAPLPSPRTSRISALTRLPRSRRSNGIFSDPGSMASASPRSRLFTRTDISPSRSIVAITSIALRPSRSIFVTTSVSPGSSRSMSRAKPGRSIAATLPEMVSAMTR